MTKEAKIYAELTKYVSSDDADYAAKALVNITSSESLSHSREYRMGKNANLAGRPWDKKQNVDWLRGWEDAQSDRGIEG